MRAKSIMTAAAVAMAIGALSAGAATAGENGGTTVQDQAQPKANDADTSRRVCRNMAPTGSRLVIRSCRTQAEWDEQARESGEGVEKNQRDSLREAVRENPL